MPLHLYVYIQCTCTNVYAHKMYMYRCKSGSNQCRICMYNVQYMYCTSDYVMYILHVHVQPDNKATQYNTIQEHLRQHTCTCSCCIVLCCIALLCCLTVTHIYNVQCTLYIVHVYKCSFSLNMHMYSVACTLCMYNVHVHVQ